MLTQPGTIERAFQLAQSGKFSTIRAIEMRLKGEQHDQVESHLSGPFIRKQLLTQCRVAHGRRTRDVGLAVHA